MKLKFGDKQSIVARNKGRVSALMKVIGCPTCKSAKLRSSSNVGELFVTIINWECRERDCRCLFSTDLKGSFIDYLI